jgi:glycosyltransferase involved in cell wall biosynthesis
VHEPASSNPDDGEHKGPQAPHRVSGVQADEPGRGLADQPGEVGADGDRPRFSVVIPALNESACIAVCLRSLAGQDFTGTWEVIVVDNNSTDRTADIAAALGATVVTEPRRGVCQARQRGTETARGEIVVSTDADTTFSPAWLSSIDRAFARRPECVAVVGPCRFVAGPRWGAAYSWLLFGLVHLLYRLTGRVFYATATNIAFRRHAWTGYDTQLTQGGDELDLLRRLRKRGDVVFDLGNPTFTSSRRLDEGLIYNIVVTCLFYYLLGYWLNRLFHRPILGMAPAFRPAHDPVTTPRRLRRVATPRALLTLIVLGSLTTGLLTLWEYV